MWGGQDPFLPNKMKPMVLEECKTQVDNAVHEAIEIAFDEMFEKMVGLNHTALEELFERNKIQE